MSASSNQGAAERITAVDFREESGKSAGGVDMDDRAIDLVYTWCDASDAAWRAKKDATAAACGLAATARGNAACRFESNDEIRFAMRSAEKFVPWVRRVFLVIDDDITPPAWLRLDHPKLRIVRLSEIMPKEALPCFCSGTIEHHLARIPGLAARYVYSNDDCMFGRPLAPSFFFARDGFPRFRFGGLRNPGPDARQANYNYICNMEQADRLIAETYPSPNGELAQASKRYPHHCIDAYVRDDVLDCFARFRDALLPTFAFPFRSPDKVQRVIYAYDAIARGRGHFRLARFRVKERRAWWKRLLRPGYADSLQFFGDGWKTGVEMLRKWRPGVFCFNDTEAATEEDRAWLRTTLESLFPERSSFEKDGLA